CAMSRKNRPITRRTMLRGLGVMMGLPLLEAMRPVGVVAGTEGLKAPVRMACLFFPNGVNPHTWTPAGQGSDFEWSPILEPLSALRDEVLILTHLTNRA